MSHPTQQQAGGQRCEEALLTPQQVQERLQIGERLTYKLLKSGELPGFRVGKLWRIREGDLYETLSRNANLSEKTSLG